ncbi:MAG: nuclear transport factor 2 family protein [Chloroflexota bacterium]|nr:nuclear transport factor 2 family protein [Chloroflexota bacterium]
MIDHAFAEQFASSWIEAWNDHDMTRILAHYTEDSELSTPFISRVASEPSGMLKGKDRISAYWLKGLQRAPDLHFELHLMLIGVNSITLYFTGALGLKSAEVFEFDSSGKVYRSLAHYAGL